jgi:hypothetical protein
MSIDWTHFAPVAALSGGLLVGIATALFAGLNGRIAGISGIVGGLLRPKNGGVAWRVAFIAGLEPISVGQVSCGGSRFPFRTRRGDES